MKITDILDIADKATLFKGGYRYTLNNFGDENKAVIRAIPEMESKLRSIVDMLPEIRDFIENTNYSCFYDTKAANLLAKIDKWENE